MTNRIQLVVCICLALAISGVYVALVSAETSEQGICSQIYHSAQFQREIAR